MYYVMRTNLDERRFVVRATVLNMAALLEFKTTKGVAFGGRFPRLQVRLDQSGDAADFFESGPLLIGSQRMRNELEDFGCSVEYHAIDLLQKNNALADQGSYYVMNLLASIDCLDYERAAYTMDGTHIDHIHVLQIDEAQVAGVALFRLKNCFDNIILACDDLVVRCRELGITGVEFVALEDWAS